jgi:hypothetical protein
VNGKDVQAVEQIAAKLVVSNRLRKIAVGGGD